MERFLERMEESEYCGVRVVMRAHLGKTEIPMKLDISTGDALTPSAISYTYRLMLENRDIRVLAYNVETMLAEKIETVLARSTLNSRMRDFYDIWALSSMGTTIHYDILAKAIAATAKKRGHGVSLADSNPVLDALEASTIMADHWARYQKGSEFAADLSWKEVLGAARALCDKAKSSGRSE